MCLYLIAIGDNPWSSDIPREIDRQLQSRVLGIWKISQELHALCHNPSWLKKDRRDSFTLHGWVFWRRESLMSVPELWKTNRQVWYIHPISRNYYMWLAVAAAIFNWIHNQLNISELQTHPNLHSPVWAGRSDTDQTHLNLQRHTRVIPATKEQTHPNLYTLIGDDRRVTYSNWAVQIRLWVWSLLRIIQLESSWNAQILQKVVGIGITWLSVRVTSMVVTVLTAMVKLERANV